MKARIPLLNPYFDIYRALTHLDPSLQLTLRKKLIWPYAWAIPSDEVIEMIVSFCSGFPVIELGAGSGYWAWLLEQAGLRVAAFDSNAAQPPHWIEVKEVAYLNWQAHFQHTLFLCWPSLNSNMAIDALRNYLGNRVIYVGEWLGRTADAEFHQQLSQSWTLIHSHPIPNWPGYSDKIYIFDKEPLN